MFEQQTMMPNPGYQFNGVPQTGPVKVMNTLNADEIKELQQQTSQFSLGLTHREVLRAQCNHRTIDGSSDSLVFDKDTGIVRCTICGYEFRPLEPDTSPEEIKNDVARLVDMLQTVKLLYTDLPADAAKEYFQIIPLIEKLPQLFEFAAKNFAKHEYNGWQYNNANMGGMAMLNNLATLFGASNGFGQPMMMNPGMNMGMPAPNPAMAAGYPQPAYGANPFGYAGASQVQPGYVPNTAGYQYTPGAAPNAPVQPTVPTPPAAPAPEAGTAETVTQNVTV